jgi:CO dehydrogenase nickel-insertion accessory protein CooC1
MIVALLGKAGAGKTTIAKAMSKYVEGSIVIDGDELREATKNFSIENSGREANIRLGYSRARELSDLGYTVFIAMQAPIKEIRDEYLSDGDVEVLVINNGRNPKDDMGYNAAFNPDYSGVVVVQELQSFKEEDFYKLINQTL